MPNKLKALLHQLAALSCLLLTAPALRGDDAVDRLVAAEMRRQHIPGLSLAVVRNGKVLKLRGYGMANVEHRVAAGPHTIYQSGSMGKQFTAALILQFVDEGKLRLDDTLGRFFPAGPEYWKQVTIQQALSHTGGLPDYYGEQDLDLRRDYTRDELLEVFGKMPQLFPPGADWSYSNVGYVLLGFIAEDLGGKSYHRLVSERIFAPLGMRTARGIEEADIVPNRSAGYRSRDGRLLNQEWVAPSLNRTADGTLYFSASDLVAWDAALAQRRLLKPASYEVMFAPARLNDGKQVPYGLGWMVGHYGGRRVVHHSGHWQGFSTAIFRDLDDRLSVILLTNLGMVDTTRLARRIAAAYEPALAEPVRRPARLTPEQLRAFAGSYEFFPARRVVLSVEDGKLMAHAQGPFMRATNKRFELTPQAGGGFFHDEYDWYVTFTRDAHGLPAALVLHQFGGQFVAERRD